MKTKNWMRKIVSVLLILSIFGTYELTLPSNTNYAKKVQKVTKVRLNRTKAVLCKNESLQLKAKGTKKKVKWKSETPMIASVSSSGKVTGKAAGTAVITATVNGRKYKCMITIKKCSLQKPVVTKTPVPTTTPLATKIPVPTTTPLATKTPVPTAKPLATKTPVPTAKPLATKIPIPTAKPLATKTPIPTTTPVVSTTAPSTNTLTEKSVYESIIKMKEKYPEGTPWTNSNYYRWKGGIYTGGYGCVAFAFLLSDEAFGNLPARKHTNFNNIKVGDILRINNDTHSVIVLEVTTDKIVVAEGNYNSSVHWGRTFDRANLSKIGNYVLTRYPL